MLHPEAATLYSVPWEYLHDGESYLLLTGKYSLVRIPWGIGVSPPLPTPRPLRILVLISSPNDQQLLNTEKEISVIQDAIDDAWRQGDIEIRFLEDARPEALRDELRRYPCHILHYTGHAAFDRTEKCGTLNMEDDDGYSLPFDAKRLAPILRQSPALRLVVLSGCQTALTHNTDAFSSVATTLLLGKIPSVVAMLCSISDMAAIEFARVFYTEIARGATISEAMLQSRLAMWNRSPGKMNDFGIPTVYLRSIEKPLVETNTKKLYISRPVVDLAGLPSPGWFVARKTELRQLRQAIRNNDISTVFVWGTGGIGKSTVVAKLLQRPGIDINQVLIIKCRETLAEEIPNKIDLFLATAGSANKSQSMTMAANDIKSIRDVARKIAQGVSEKTCLIVFDGLEHLMFNSDVRDDWHVSDEKLVQLLQGLIEANWKSKIIFTSRVRWNWLFKENLGRCCEIKINELDASASVMLMRNLPNLSRLSRQQMIFLRQRIGGHPKTIELLDGWFACGGSFEQIERTNLPEGIIDMWQKYFLKGLLEELKPDERSTFEGVAILEGSFWLGSAKQLGVNEEMLERWQNIGLISVVGSGIKSPWWRVHDVIRAYVVSQAGPEKLRLMHEKAATCCRYEIGCHRLGKKISEEEEREWDKVHRKWDEGDNELLFLLLNSTADTVHSVLPYATRLCRHLLAAERNSDAYEILKTEVARFLGLTGHWDLSENLLKTCRKRLSGIEKAYATVHLASLVRSRGRFKETKELCEEAFPVIMEQGIDEMKAAILSMLGVAHLELDEYDQAFALQRQAMLLPCVKSNPDDLAIVLNEISLFYMHKERFDRALRINELAKRNAEKSIRRLTLATVFLNRGTIFMYMGRVNDSMSCFSKCAEIAQASGDASLAMKANAQAGRLALQMGQPSIAGNVFQIAVDEAVATGDPVTTALRLECLGFVHEEQQQYIEALEKYRQALMLFQKHGTIQQQERTQANITRVEGNM
jgi:tetratricopeptide (TPR) repeat protein